MVRKVLVLCQRKDSNISGKKVRKTVKEIDTNYKNLTLPCKEEVEYEFLTPCIEEDEGDAKCADYKMTFDMENEKVVEWVEKKKNTYTSVILYTCPLVYIIKENFLRGIWLLLKNEGSVYVMAGTRTGLIRSDLLKMSLKVGGNNSEKTVQSIEKFFDIGDDRNISIWKKKDTIDSTIPIDEYNQKPDSTITIDEYNRRFEAAFMSLSEKIPADLYILEKDIGDKIPPSEDLSIYKMISKKVEESTNIEESVRPSLVIRVNVILRIIRKPSNYSTIFLENTNRKRLELINIVNAILL